MSAFKNLVRLLLDPYPMRTIILNLVKKAKIGSYEQRVKIGALDRPHYGYCVYNAVALAKKLGYAKISVLEFGVAGGGGLIDLEYHARECSKMFGVEVEVYGFDTGEGLPDPIDYRDLPYHWQQGFFKMDIPALRKKLENSKLVLGNIQNTSLDFFTKYNPAPVGAIFYDFDFYSSTVVALKMLEKGDCKYLPRVFCYFDDVTGTEIELYNDFTGERLALNEFNEKYKHIKFGKAYHLLTKKAVENWYHKIWILHFFEHKLYNNFVSDNNQQMPI